MTRKTVLLVESDFALRSEVSRLLDGEDVAVTGTDDCEAAFRLVATRAFDVVVINTTVAVLPGGSGLLQHVRHQNACMFVSSAGEVWLNTTDMPEQIVMRGEFTTREFAACIADSVRKVLRSESHILPATSTITTT